MATLYELLGKPEVTKSNVDYLIYHSDDLVSVATAAGSPQRAGHYDAALGWLERAYDESQGPATRFQWGANYLQGLLEMAPEDGARKTCDQFLART